MMRSVSANPRKKMIKIPVMWSIRKATFRDTTGKPVYGFYTARHQAPYSAHYHIFVLLAFSDRSIRQCARK